MIPTIGYAAQNATAPLERFQFNRRDPGPEDVQIEISYCGICHTDIHQARNEWNGSAFPMVPGHEIVGRITQTGKNVKKFKAGDWAGIGCMVDSCRNCSSCRENLEQYCMNGPRWTYNSPDQEAGQMTYGGFSKMIVVNEQFALRLSAGLNLPATAPLLCAGITTYSPLRYWKVGKGHKVGVVGLGGLGHMAVKFSHAFGAETILFTTTANKTQDAKRMGADEVVLSKNRDEMKKHLNSFDFILDTAGTEHNLDPYLELLKRDGSLCLVGLPSKPHPSPSVIHLIIGRRKLAGSVIGGIKETQEMLDFCSQHQIVSEVEIIPIQQVNTAFERMLKSDVKYRFVIDLSSLK